MEIPTMALTSAPDLGETHESLDGVYFKMRDGDKIVHCLVTNEALADRASCDGLPENGGCDLFKEYRPEIEEIASLQYSGGVEYPNVDSMSLAPPQLAY